MAHKHKLRSRQPNIHNGQQGVTRQARASSIAARTALYNSGRSLANLESSDEMLDCVARADTHACVRRVARMG